jgi:hypothetical protein
MSKFDFDNKLGKKALQQMYHSILMRELPVRKLTRAPRSLARLATHHPPITHPSPTHPICPNVLRWAPLLRSLSPSGTLIYSSRSRRLIQMSRNWRW